jgi:hypothetical protein
MEEMRAKLAKEIALKNSKYNFVINIGSWLLNFEKC